LLKDVVEDARWSRGIDPGVCEALEERGFGILGRDARVARDMYLHRVFRVVAAAH